MLCIRIAIQLTVNEYFRGLSHCIHDNHTGIESKLTKIPPNNYKQKENYN